MNTPAILKKVVADYSLIADEFDATRQHPWPEFEAFLKHIDLESADILDAGCGNGRLAHFLKEYAFRYEGLDATKELITSAKKNAPLGRILTHFRVGRLEALPYKAKSFDTVFCIAALHHLPTHALQLKALRGFKKSLRAGGALCLTVWNLWQPKYRGYIDRKTHHSLIPWGEKKTQRFYYAFTLKELREILKEAGFTKVTRIPSTHNFALFCR